MLFVLLVLLLADGGGGGGRRVVRSKLLGESGSSKSMFISRKFCWSCAEVEDVIVGF